MNDLLMRLRRGGTPRALAAAPILLAAGLLFSGPAARAAHNEHTVAPERLYRSAQVSPDELERLIRTKGIRTVIALRGGDESDRWFRGETEVCRQHGVQHYLVALNATHLPPAAEMRRLLEAFDHAQYPVLIHCRAGSDRTGLAAALYLAVYDGVPVDQARHRELSLKYGHFAIGPAGAMDRFFKLYDRTADGLDLRTWIEKRYPALQQDARAGGRTPAGPDTPDTGVVHAASVTP